MEHILLVSFLVRKESYVILNIRPGVNFIKSFGSLNASFCNLIGTFLAFYVCSKFGTHINFSQDFNRLMKKVGHAWIRTGKPNLNGMKDVLVRKVRNFDG